MANPERLEKLEEEVEARNAWREVDHPDGGLGDGK